MLWSSLNQDREVSRKKREDSNIQKWALEMRSKQVLDLTKSSLVITGQWKKNPNGGNQDFVLFRLGSDFFVHLLWMSWCQCTGISNKTYHHSAGLAPFMVYRGGHILASPMVGKITQSPGFSALWTGFTIWLDKPVNVSKTQECASVFLLACFF